MRFARAMTLAVMRTAALVTCVLAIAALPQVVPPEQLQHAGAVNDFANVLSPADRDALEQRAISLEQRDGIDVVMVTVNSTGDTPIFDYTYALASRWGVGQKGRDNGVLILLAIKDRKFWVQVGRGLEPYFTDADAAEWIRRQAPDLRTGHYATVLNVMLDHIEQTVALRMRGEGQLRPEAPRRSAPQISPLAVFITIIVILVLLSLLRRAAGCGPMGCLPIFWGGGPGWGGGGYYGGGWSGGGFGGFGGGGGGGGGFGGFGGGSFGGGGGGGGW